MTEAGDIIKSGAAKKAMDLVNKIAGPLAEEVGMMLGDKVRVYRVKNLIKTTEKTERMLLEAGLSPNAVPPRLFLPIMEACSVEDNETLQEMWAALLATASQQTDAVSPSFIETLRHLTPDEARFFRLLYDGALSERRRQGLLISPLHPTAAGYPLPAPVLAFSLDGAARDMSLDTYERLGLIRRNYDVTNNEAGSALAEEGYATIFEAELVFEFVFTEYAAKFVRACEGPRAEALNRDSK